MKIRNGFVSNSSSSSFIITDIAKRDDPFSDYPPQSSLTEFYKTWQDKNSYNAKFPSKKGKNVYQVSLSSGKTYSIEEIASFLRKYSYEAKCLDHYEEDWQKYLENYPCVIMNIKDCKYEDTPEIVEMEWGENYIWNKCDYCFEGGTVGKTQENRTVQYAGNPFYRFIVNSKEYNDLKEKVKIASEESNKDWDEYWNEYKKFEIGERETEPIYPNTSNVKLSNLSIGEIICKICHDHKANVCFNVAEAIDKGSIYIYAEDNYFSWDFMEELKNNFQCILYAEHMG